MANLFLSQHWLGRARSGLLLGKCVSFMLQHDFPMTLRSVAFKATLHFFISSVFPADITRTMKYDAAVFHRDTYVSPFVLQTRIIMVHALGCFFRCPEAYEPEFLDYIDTLFSAILQSDQNVLLQIAVIHVLANHLPVINRNRLRVEVFYREAILKLFQSANGCNLLGLDETPASKSRLSSSGEEGDGLNDSEDSNASTETSNPSVVAATSAAPAKSVLIKLALIEMDHFSKIWYPQLHDSTIMYLQSNPGTSKVLSTNEGYGWRRWQWLTTREAPTFHQIRANRNIPTVPEISPPFILKKGLQLSAYHRSAEVALDPSQYKVAPKNKPALKISTHSFSKVTGKSPLLHDTY